jgi:hypothetical protein
MYFYLYCKVNIKRGCLKLLACSVCINLWSSALFVALWSLPGHRGFQFRVFCSCRSCMCRPNFYLSFFLYIERYLTFNLVVTLKVRSFLSGYVAMKSFMRKFHLQRKSVRRQQEFDNHSNKETSVHWSETWKRPSGAIHWLQKRCCVVWR